MLEEIIIKGTELSTIEIQELDDIYRLTNPKMPENHIRVNHIDKCNPTFYIYKINGKIEAFQAYTIYKNTKTPFWKKSIPVIYMNLSYKNAASDVHIRNFSKKAIFAAMRTVLGRFWFLKKFALVFQTYNPKLMARVEVYFSESYPHYSKKTTKEVHQFVQSFFNKEMKWKDTVINENLIKQERYATPSLISDKWEQHYKSDNDLRNKFFHENDIIIKKDGAYYLTGKALFFIGYYNIWKNLTAKFSGKKIAFSY